MSNLYKPPESEILSEADKKNKPHGFWTVYFWFNVLLTPLVILTIFLIEGLNALDYIDSATLLFILPGLYGYTFSKRILSQLVWKTTCYMYPVWFIFYGIIVPFLLNIPQYGTPTALDGEFWFSLILGIPTCILFYLYAFKAEYLWAPEQGRES